MLGSFEVRGESVSRVTFCGIGLQWLVAETSGMVPKMWDKQKGKVFGLVWILDSVRLCTASTHWNVPKKYGPDGELFFFF